MSPLTGSDHKVTKPPSPPEPLVEYPLRDSMESSNVSHYRTAPQTNRDPYNESRLETTVGSNPPRDSMESSSVLQPASHYRTLPLQKRLETTDVEATPLESFPMDSRLDSTKLNESRKSVQPESVLMSETRQDVPFQVRGVHGMKMVTLPPYEEGNRREVTRPSGNQQTAGASKLPPVSEHRSQIAQGISPPQSDGSTRLKSDDTNLPRSGDISNFP